MSSFRELRVFALASTLGLLGASACGLSPLSPQVPSKQGGTTSSSEKQTSSAKDDETTSGEGEDTKDDATSSSTSTEDQSSSELPGELPKDEVPADFREFRSSKERDESPEIEKEDLEIVRAGNNDLGFEVQRRLAFEDDKNGAVSPVSLQLAMGLLHAAAKGETQSEMQKTFGFHTDPEKTHRALNQLSLQLAALEEEKTDVSEPVFVRIANRTFVRPDTKVGTDYLDTLATQYGAGVYLADFQEDPWDVTRKINAWVAKITENKIPKLFPPQALKRETVWASVNAIYFKAPWTQQFAEASTRDAKFTKLDGEIIQVKMMSSSQDEAKFGQDDQSSWAEIALGQKRALKAIFVLPKRGQFKKIEQGMSSERLDEMLKASKPAQVKLQLPKFKVETGSLSMVEIFKEMGASKLFGEADLSGISDDGKSSLPGLDTLYHSVFVAMDETGVEAAAATGGASNDSEPTEKKTLIVDRPFLFVIYDSRSGLVMFNGRVVDPEWK